MNSSVFTLIESPRLLLRHFNAADLPVFHAYRNDPQVAEYQGWEPTSEDRARDFISEMEKAQPGVPGEWFQFAVELRESNLLIGDCALKVDADEPRQGQIGYTFAREHQGKGYASEAISSLLSYVFHTLGLHRIYALVICENVRSVALLERIGMRREGYFIQEYWHNHTWVDEYLYAILETEWLATPLR